jgi:hypothetical protein
MSADDPDQPDDEEAATPGWDAIDAALAPFYAEQEPVHYAPTLPPQLGGDQPLSGISIYRRREPTPHYHYVTYGFSDLFGDGEPGSEFSGFGFELTFRLATNDPASEPPTWPVDLLQNLAKYVFKTGNYFESGHHVNCNGPIALGTETDLGYVAFITDPELGGMETPLGRVEFLQVVGLCEDEFETLKHWKTEGFLKIIERQYPLLVTDLARKSILRDPALAAEVEQAIVEEGASQTTVFAMVNHFEQSGEEVRLRISANVIGDLLLMFDHQLANDHPCAVLGEKNIVHFAPAAHNEFRIADNELTLELSPPLREEIRRTLKIERGEYRWETLPHFVLEVVPTEIKDQDGNIVAVFG